MGETIWKEIKCKTCGCQDKPLFMIQPAHSSDDCYCKECMEKERLKRASSSP